MMRFSESSSLKQSLTPSDCVEVEVAAVASATSAIQFPSASCTHGRPSKHPLSSARTARVVAALLLAVLLEFEFEFASEKSPSMSTSTSSCTYLSEVDMSQNTALRRASGLLFLSNALARFVIF